MPVLEKCFLESKECKRKNGRLEISNCHSISRSKVLEQISNNFHVQTILPSKEKLIFVPKGIRQHASTFRGYCNNHDSKLFNLLDKTDFDATNLDYFHQLVLRSVSHELWKKQNIIYQAEYEKVNPTRRGNNQNLNPIDEISRIGFLNNIISDYRLGVKYLLHEWQILIKSSPLLYKRYLRFPSRHKFACSSIASLMYGKNDEKYPTYTYQDIIRPHNVFLDVFPEGKETIVIMSTFQAEKRSIEFIDSLSWNNVELLKEELSRFIITHIENFFVPNDYFTNEDREIIEKLFHEFVEKRIGWNKIQCPNLFISNKK